MSYLPLETIVRRISFLNRKLYIVSGDLQLLQQYSKKLELELEQGGDLVTQKKMAQDDVSSANFPAASESHLSSVAKFAPEQPPYSIASNKRNKFFNTSTSMFSFGGKRES